MKYHIVTLGCPKNAVDSEGMAGILTDEGHTPADTPGEADLIIVNTCSFIAAARAETVDTLRALGESRRAGQRIIAAGCMAQSHRDEVAAIPGVDHTLGTQQWMHIGELAGERTVSNGRQVPVIGLAPAAASKPSALSPQPSESYADWRTAQIRRTHSAPSAYLKISDGCNLRCAFCTIPSFKGDMASKPVGAVLGEAQELVARGVREIVLVAQHLSDYGRDLGLNDGLATLLDELCQMLPEHVWVRLMYAYPHGITGRLIEVMATRPQICKYLDMPLQHAHPATLRRMRRPPDTERTMGLIGDLRAAMPDIALRSTFIVGFPGETTEEYRALLTFLEQAQLDRVGAFRYSQEPGTHAATLSDQVRPQVIEKRWHELMQLQRHVSIARTGRWIGRTLPVLIEGHGVADGRPIALGRSFRDAPEIDGQVFVWGHPPVGTIIPVHVTRTTEYDLWGEPA
ncbi:MAG: 30S ribosomal protein S12 methylthiotransferase RimO [Chloroflexales bacterium]|nr:30S ribosomal protein S12 methylthiotransferase RimO [Chloroflexales bacterium]